MLRNDTADVLLAEHHDALVATLDALEERHEALSAEEAEQAEVLKTQFRRFMVELAMMAAGAATGFVVNWLSVAIALVAVAMIVVDTRDLLVRRRAVAALRRRRRDLGEAIHGILGEIRSIRERITRETSNHG